MRVGAGQNTGEGNKFFLREQDRLYMLDFIAIMALLWIRFILYTLAAYILYLVLFMLICLSLNVVFRKINVNFS